MDLADASAGLASRAKIAKDYGRFPRRATSPCGGLLATQVAIPGAGGFTTRMVSRVDALIWSWRRDFSTARRPAVFCLRSPANGAIDPDDDHRANDG